jgi:hypothetical protein
VGTLHKIVLVLPNSGVEATVAHQEIPGSNPGQVSKTCWPNGKAPDYG